MLLRIAIGLCAAGILFFIIGPASAEQAGEDMQALLLREKELGAKVERLRREQEFFLFKKEFYTSDSKYLILDPVSNTGQLRYKNRLLKEFRFRAPSPQGTRTLPRGVLVLVKKLGSDHNRLTLIFSGSLIIKSMESGRQAVRKSDTPRLYLKKSDMISLFYALEVGGRAYVLHHDF